MAGESARDKYEGLRQARRARLQQARSVLIGLAVLTTTVGAAISHALLDAWWLGAVGGLLPVAGLMVPTQQEIAWRKGAEGEATVGRALDGLEPDAWALHDRLIPGTRANIDHILVAPTGIWVIDAKNYTGKIETRGRGKQVWINGRNRSALLDQAYVQQRVVSETLRAAGLGAVPVRSVLCFVGAEWPLVFRPRQAREVFLTSRRRLHRLVTGDSVVPLSVMRQATYAIEQRLVPAAGRSRTTPPR